MGEVIKFRHSCSECIYSGKFSNCTNELYQKNMYHVVVELRRCPYFKKKDVATSEKIAN